MITFRQTDIFNSEAEALVNTVNLVGVMGKGIALQFKERFPLNFKLYQHACKIGSLKIGEVLVSDTGFLTNPKYIVNFPTKADWREKSKLRYLEDGLDSLIKTIKEKGIKSIALPPLGCGNGGLDWQDVKSLMIDKLSILGEELDIEIYEPGYHSYTRTTGTKEPKLTKVRALVLALAEKYNVLGFDISHLEIQKLVYFLQEFGQSDFNLKFSKGHYGPYAINLKHLLAHLEGYYFKGQIRFQDMKPTDSLEIISGKLPEVHALLDVVLDEEEKNRLDKLSNFIEGFESPFGMELLASVHWAFKELGSNCLPQDIHGYIRAWSARKGNAMTEAYVSIALRRIKQYSE
jgi:O-acetyl-ADP-ribose deacetylase (regulator of RNase III)